MLRKFLSLVLAAVAVLCAVWTFRPEFLPWSGVTTGVDAFSAAQMMRETMAREPQHTSFTFRDRALDRTELFRTLEATWPYAFSLSTTVQANGVMDVSVIVENQAAQEQAAVLARGIVQNTVTRDMTMRERLRVLHDYVVRHATYDTDTAASETLEQGTGADAPFTAVGALIDGKAVCAGYARSYMLLCDAAGMDAVYIADEKMNHGWNAVRVYDQILYVDTTFDDPVPDRGDKVSSTYFLVNGEQLATDHQWNRAFYDKLIERLLPESLGDAQRLYDLGLLPEAPRAAQMTQPLTQGARDALEQTTGWRFAQGETLGKAAHRVWLALSGDQLGQTLLTQGRIDADTARKVGLTLRPEGAK